MTASTASVSGGVSANKWDERNKAQEDDYFVKKEKELLQLSLSGRNDRSCLNIHGLEVR
jgi:hypothetical protein